MTPFCEAASEIGAALGHSARLFLLAIGTIVRMSPDNVQCMFESQHFHTEALWLQIVALIIALVFKSGCGVRAAKTGEITTSS